MRQFFHCALLALILLSACKSAPPPEEEFFPGKPFHEGPLREVFAALVFEGIEAGSPDELSLIFTLGIENPLPLAGGANIASWQAEINGKKAQSGLTLETPESGFPLKAGAPSSFPLRLHMDMTALAAEGHVPRDEYQVKLIVELDFLPGIIDSSGTAGAAPSMRLEVSGLAEFPGVQAPEFRISAIAILRAELINTRFRVTMEIDNPNPFPIELSALSFELYGNGRLWADGTERNILRLPPRSTAGASLFLLMNFIDMSRDLLDQIIRLQDTNYRFTGEAQVSTGVEYLPMFTTGFDLSGYSQVLDN